MSGIVYRMSYLHLLRAERLIAVKHKEFEKWH